MLLQVVITQVQFDDGQMIGGGGGGAKVELILFRGGDYKLD